MILVSLIVLPILGGLVAFFSGWISKYLARPIAFIFCLIELGILMYAWHQGESSTSMEDLWLVEWQQSWMPLFGIEFHFGLDGLSFCMLFITFLLGAIVLFVYKPAVKTNESLFYLLFMLVVSGMAGVLLSLDMFLFFVFWEAVLLPLYLATAIWGGKNRNFATTQFLVFTQISGLLLLFSTVTLALLHHAQTGVFTFNFNQLLQTSFSGSFGFWIMLGFLVAFLVKLPAFPFHVWMPPLFEESPVSFLMVGIMVKTGAYGLLRFVLPLFASEIEGIRFWLFMLGIVSVLYGAVLAFAERNPFRILAYATLSHMGLILVGIFSENDLALSGVVVSLVAQALSTGALLMLLHRVSSQLGETRWTEVGGLFKVLPGISVFTVIFAMASIALPGMGNFVGEWLILLGVFHDYFWVAAFASSGIVLGAVYTLWLIQKLFYGPLLVKQKMVDVTLHEKVGYGLVVAVLLGIGLYPSMFLDIVSSVWQDEVQIVQPATSMKHTNKIQITIAGKTHAP